MRALRSTIAAVRAQLVEATFAAAWAEGQHLSLEHLVAAISSTPLRTSTEDTRSDFAAAFHFYTAVLGMNAIDAKPDFALFETTGMTLELFNGGIPPSPQRPWGHGQAVRPSIQVADLQGTIAELHQRGVQFTGDIERASWGEWIEFMATEQIHWTLAHAPSYPCGASLHRPHIGWVEIKVHRLAEQRAFYCDVMGLKPDECKEGQVILRQEPGEPLLLLASGGQPGLTSAIATPDD